MSDEEIIPRKKLAGQVLDRLIDMIRNGEVPPGERMPSERTLMERYGVGRPAIREAMQTLEGLGMLTIRHGERAQVRLVSASSMFEQIDLTARHLLSTSPQNLAHLKEARLLFELDMVRIAAERAGEADIARLRAALEAQENSADTRSFVAADIAFHGALAAISGNPIYAAVSHAMLNWLIEYHFELVHAAGLEQLTLTEHAAIVAQVAAGDTDGAARAMADHLNRVNELYRREQDNAGPGDDAHSGD